MADRVGTFEVGKEFDALLVDTCLGGTAGPFDVFPGEDDEQRFEKFINLGDDRNLAEVYVQVGKGACGGAWSLREAGGGTRGAKGVLARGMWHGWTGGMCRVWMCTCMWGRAPGLGDWTRGA